MTKEPCITWGLLGFPYGEGAVFDRGISPDPL